MTEYQVDRSGWPPGQWDYEPEDRAEWRDAGFPCLAVRGPLGAWCGYVGVSPGHPWHGKSYNDLDVEVHGGLTYAAACQKGGPICHVPAPGEPDDVWWVGFDCAHTWDRAPGLAPFGHDGTYRTLAYVRLVVASLAAQAKAAAEGA